MESLHATAIKNLLAKKADMPMIVDGKDYDSICIEEDDNVGVIDKPTEEEVEKEVARLQGIIDSKKEEYPTPEEWILALVQREVDNDPTEWNELVERRRIVKDKYNQINSPISE